MKVPALLIACLLPLSVVAQPVVVDSTELRAIHHELKRLRAQLDHIESLLNQPPPAEPVAAKQWGCYMDDISAGGVYGVGATEAEAKGRALEQCEMKKGTCFEVKLKCTTNP